MFFLILLLFQLCQSEYRSINGSGNNLNNPFYGTSYQPYHFCSKCEPNYIDGQSPNWTSFPNSRQMSNLFADIPHRPNPRSISDMHIMWGIVLHSDVSSSVRGASEAVPIDVPKCDIWFDSTCKGNVKISFARNAYINRTHNGKLVRTGINGQTTWVDGSWIYGPNDAIHSYIREFSGGRMKLSNDGLPPKADYNPTVPLFILSLDPQHRMAGYPFVNLNTGTISLSSIFLREHNRLAAEYQKKNPNWSDEKIFQESRRKVIAILQCITYRNYLPIITGRPLPAYSGYNPSLEPTLDTAWSHAAFRYGHSELLSTVLRLNMDFSESLEGNICLRDVILQPSSFIGNGIEQLIRGLSTQVARSVGLKASDDIKNYFGTKTTNFMLDLVAVDIQRGRDVGVPLYNKARVGYGLKPVTRFDQISSSPIIQTILAKIYPTVDDVELYVGGLAEDHVPGASLGELFIAITNQQFDLLRSSDRFWYENNQFTSEEIYEIEHTTLEQIITRNTNITNLQPNVFFVPTERINKRNEIAFPDPDTFFEGRTVFLNPRYRFSWKVVEPHIIVQLEVGTNGWFGIGFNPDLSRGSMVKVDIIMCNSSNNRVMCSDMYSYQIGPPQYDVTLGGQDNIFDLQFSISSSLVTVRFKKPLKSGDIFDNPIVPYGSNNVIYAYNEMTDFLSYHGPNRGTQLLVFGNDTSKQSESIPTWLIALLVSVVVVLIIIICLLILLRRKRYKKWLASIPMGTITLAFTDIEDSTKLWDQNPDLMRKALQIHNSVIRKVMDKYKVYEVKTQGDSFMMASNDTCNLVNCALEIQKELINANWNEDLLMMKEYQPTFVDNELMWRGLRVRIGVHVGIPEVHIDSRNQMVDYLGPMVNLCARIESVAKGGEICISDEVHRYVIGLLRDDVIIQELGPHKLKGIDQQQLIYMVLPLKLRGRSRRDFTIREFTTSTFTMSAERSLDYTPTNDGPLISDI